MINKKIKIIGRHLVDVFLKNGEETDASIGPGGHLYRAHEVINDSTGQQIWGREAGILVLLTVDR
jgi:hypothetical protein